MAKHNELGKTGEQAAVDFLLQQGHTLLAQNYRHSRAEIDIITRHNNAVVFTEVKTRSTNNFGFPEEYVDKKKIKLIKAAAEEYIYQNKLDCDLRFDVISITETQGKLDIHYIMDAFGGEEDLDILSP